MGMYPVSVTPMDSQLWQLIAFCAGTGGSMLVIGSAAGVALMGLEKVDFVWYAKKVSIAATVGYLAGIATYLVQTGLLSQWVTSILPAVAMTTPSTTNDILTTASSVIIDTTATVSSTIPAVISNSLNLAQVGVIDTTTTIVSSTVTATSDVVNHFISNLDFNHILTIISSFFY